MYASGSYWSYCKTILVQHKNYSSCSNVIMKNTMQILNRRKIGFSITNLYIWLSLQLLQKRTWEWGIGCWHHGSRRGWWTAESNWCLMIRRSGFHNRNICYATSILQINYKKRRRLSICFTVGSEVNWIDGFCVQNEQRFVVRCHGCHCYLLSCYPDCD